VEIELGFYRNNSQVSTLKSQRSRSTFSLEN
jgi:hypothetical protein